MTNEHYVKTIHRFWEGSEMPEQYRFYGEEWQRLNLDWEVKDWDASALALIPEKLPELAAVITDLYDRDNNQFGIELYVQLADVIGYVLVQVYGGIYVNCDIQPVRTLPQLPDRAWASYENNEDGRVVNAAIAAPTPGDIFWTTLLQFLPARYFANPSAEMVETTGPAFLTDFYHQRRDQLVVFPTETFNPVHWKQIPSGSDASSFVDLHDFPEVTIGVHHWGHKRDGRTNRVESATPYA